jgi:threonine synthase
MKFVSTNGSGKPVTFMEAMERGLAPDGGLYVPDSIPLLDSGFLKKLPDLDFGEIAFEMARPYLEGEIGTEALLRVIEHAFNFPVKLIEVENGQFVLELFHGPTLAFKDFGARFMARLFFELAKERGGETTILAATSGDTGSAVANGFNHIPGVRVVVLYPKGKVSSLQEKQFTTLGSNISAVEVDGVFDDCQKLVKMAFMDENLNGKMRLSSANSINIARLLPQSFYYAYAVGQLGKRNLSSVSFSVPSGNFGNLTAGLIANRMGIPAGRFIAATNSNDVVPNYLAGSEFLPASSKQTISNAMDVGDPSNFARIRHLFGGDDQNVRNEIAGYSFSDEETRDTIRTVYKNSGYILCPHTAVGYRAAELYRKTAEHRPAVTLATAHPVKFREVIEPVIGRAIEVPERLKPVLQKEGNSLSIPADYKTFTKLLTELQR